MTGGVRLRQWAHRLLRRLHRARVDREMDEEMRFHVLMEVEEMVRDGIPEPEARRRALAQFGGIANQKEIARDNWPLRWLESLVADMRFAGRSLRRAPSFTLAAVGALALAIGVNATVFSAVDSVAFRPLAVRSPERLVAVYGVQGEATLLPFSYASYVDLGRASDAIVELAAVAESPISLRNGDEASAVWAAHVSGNYFTMLGVSAALGRAIRDDEFTAPVAMLSHAAWVERFNSDPGIVGRVLTINGSNVTVVGVAPAQFTGTRLFTYEPSVWLPAGLHKATIPASDGLLTRRDAARFNVVGRMRDGVSIDRARESADAAVRTMAATYPDLYRGLHTEIISNRTPINPWLAPPARIATIGWLLLAGVSLVLLIACANVANLLLARFTVRRDEVAVRLALGASRRRLVQQFLVESLAVSAIGALAAIPVRAVALRGIAKMAPHLDYVSWWRPPADLRVLVYTLVLTVGAAVVFGLAPAVHAARFGRAPGLRVGAAGGAKTRSRLREGLIVGQVALSALVLATAGMFVRSMREARATDVGFGVDGAVAFTLDPQLSPVYDTAQTRRLYARITSTLASLPGVTAVARASSLPLDGNGSIRRVFVDGRAYTVERAPVAEFALVTPGYFRAMDTPILSGREFVAGDSARQGGVAVINDVLARRLWPRESAIGKQLRIESPTTPLVEIVGVARASAYRAVGEAPRSALWLDLDGSARSRTTIVVRGPGRERAVVASIRATLRDIDPTLPIIGLATLRERLSVAYAAVDSGALGAAGFGVLAALLAATGIYGIIAYGVHQRRREIGIRVALGARRGAIVTLVVGRAVALTLLGLALGIALWIVVPMGLERILFGVSRGDPLTLLVTASVLGGIACVAALLPVYRALRLDPTHVLRIL